MTEVLTRKQIQTITFVEDQPPAGNTLSDALPVALDAQSE